MKSLLIETSTEEAICALFNGENILYLSSMPRGFQQSRFLISEIDAALKSQKISLASLSFIAIGIGPGSYTGIRIGAMAAKTLSWVTKVPLVPISSLEGIAPHEEGPFIAALDAKISGAYVLYGEKRGQEILSKTPQVLRLEDLSKEIHEPIRIVSPHAELLKKRWKEKDLSAKVQWMEGELNAALLIKRACDRFQKGLTANDRTLELQYLRSSI